MSARDVYERGMRIRRQVLGDAHVDSATAAATDITADFQDLITRYAWGDVWARPGLDRRMRSCIALTALIAHGHHREFELHLHAARRNGLTKAEIIEILLQTAIYCGVPAANAAFTIAARVLHGQPGPAVAEGPEPEEDPAHGETADQEVQISNPDAPARSREAA